MHKVTFLTLALVMTLSIIIVMGRPSGQEEGGEGEMANDLRYLVQLTHMSRPRYVYCIKHAIPF